MVQLLRGIVIDADSTKGEFRIRDLGSDTILPIPRIGFSDIRVGSIVSFTRDGRIIRRAEEEDEQSGTLWCRNSKVWSVCPIAS